MIDTNGFLLKDITEAPVQIVDIYKNSNCKYAGNVAANLKKLEIEPILYSVIGNDNSEKDLLELLNNFSINKSNLLIQEEEKRLKK